MPLRLGAAFASCFMAVTAVAIVGAEPAEAAGHTRPYRTADRGWRLPLAHVGYPDVKLKGQIATSEVFVPVPRGLRPQALTARVGISPDVGSGYLEFRQDDTTIETFVLTRAQHLRGARIKVPLADARVSQGVLGLTLYARIRTADNACESAIIGTRVTLEDAEIAFGGTAAPPSSVGDFLPPILDRLTVAVPSAPTAAEAAAALRIASAAVHRYGGQAIDVRLTKADRLPAVNDVPFSRTIVIRRGGTAGAALVRAGRGHVLQLSGSPEVLSRSAGAFAGSLSTLAVGTSLQAMRLDDALPFSGERYTFEALGFRQLQATGVGRIEIPMSFSQYGLGGSVRGLTLQLNGVHTPVADGAHATLGLLVNGVLVRAVELDSSGAFDATLEVPSHLIQRDNSMTIRVDYAPDDGVCILGIHPFTLQVSPRSTVDVERGDGVNQGFLRYPQALRNGFDVAFDEVSFGHVRIAFDLLLSLQRLAGAPLEPSVVPWRAARRSKRTLILITADPSLTRGMDPPLDPDPFRVVDGAGRVVMEMRTDASFAALEAFRWHNRDVLLLAGKGGLSLMSKLARGLWSESGSSAPGWFGLTGDVLVQPESGPPVNVNLRSRALRAEPLTPVASKSSALLRTASVPLAVITALILLAFVYPRLVRRAPEDRASDEA